MIKVILIGTGTCIPTRNAPGLLVEINDKPIVFDSGSGYLYNLRKVGVNYKDIDYIFYTHLHNDHIADLGPFLWAYLNDVPEPRKRELNLLGPEGMEMYVNNLLNEFIRVSRKNLKKGEEPFKINIKELDKDDFEFDDIIIKSEVLKHVEKIKSLGYRIEAEGKVIVYSGDTGFCNELIELAKNADLLVVECSQPQHIEGHLNPLEVGEIATKANVKKVVLVHMYPSIESYDVVKDIKENFKGEIIVGEDLTELEV